MGLLNRWDILTGRNGRRAVERQPLPLTQVADIEMARWEEALAHEAGTGRLIDPPLDAANGLPSGWHLVGDVTDCCTIDDLGEETLHLVRRDNGGWFLLRRHGPLNITTVHHADEVLSSLVAHVDGTDPRVAGWLRGLIVERFDDTDPVESRERVLFALGGPLVHMPRRLA